MGPLVWYYLHEPGRGLVDNGIEPTYINPSYLQRGHGTGSSEALVAGRHITDMADPNAKIRVILRIIVTESVHRVISKLSGQGRKRKSARSNKRGGKAKRAKKHPSRRKNKKNIKRDIFS